MSGELAFLVNRMFFFYITCKSILVHVRVVQGRIQEFFIGGGEGGSKHCRTQKGLLKLFCGKLLVTEMTRCYAGFYWRRKY